MGNRKATEILVLGGGFGGVYSALRLERAFKRDQGVHITLVSDENFFLFTPFLHEVATGGVETRHICYPIRRLRGQRRFTFFQSVVQAIDLPQKKVVTAHGTLDYDYLVLALGSITDMSSLPSTERNVFTLKNLHDGMVLRNHVIDIFERADAEADPERQRELLTFAVAGGGYTGVQLVAELRDFLHRFLIKEYTNLRPALTRILLVQAQERILTDMDPKLATIALKVLEKKGIDVRLKSSVTRVWETGIELNGAEAIPTQTLVWATGVVANPLVAALPVERDEGGRVIVNEYLEVPGYPGVYALGDNAHFRNPKTGQALPQKAHIAVRQPKTVASNILAELKGKPKKPYRYSLGGELVSLGSRSAVAHLFGLRLHGFMVKLIWLVAYLAIMAGPYNRTRVILDWFLSLFFGRDSTLLRIR